MAKKIIRFSKKIPKNAGKVYKARYGTLKKTNTKKKIVPGTGIEQPLVKKTPVLSN